jgi:hypothetical protein
MCGISNCSNAHSASKPAARQAVPALHHRGHCNKQCCAHCRDWQQGQSQPLREPDAVSIQLAQDLDWVDPRDR